MSDMSIDVCGTYPGYQRHRVRKEIACDDCVKAHRLWTRFYRFRRGSQHDLTRCQQCGSVFPEHSCGSIGIRKDVQYLHQSLWDRLTGGGK